MSLSRPRVLTASGTSLLALLISLLLVLGFAGCYDEPLTNEPSRPIDEKLLGTWKSVKSDPMTVRFMRLGKDQYFVEMIEPKKPVYHARAFLSTIDGQDFLNVQDVGEVPVFVGKDGSRDKYVFYVYKVEGNGKKLRLSLLDLDAEQDASSGALRQELRRRLKSRHLKAYEWFELRKVK